MVKYREEFNLLILIKSVTVNKSRLNHRITVLEIVYHEYSFDKHFSLNENCALDSGNARALISQVTSFLVLAPAK